MKQKGVFSLKLSHHVGGARILAWYAEDARAKKIMNEVEIGKKTLMWVHKARYPEHHRYAFAVLAKIGDAMGLPAETILLWLKYETGRCDWIRMPDGRTVEHPQSIAFESMDQKEFQKFWDDALVVIKDKVLPRVPQEVYDEIVAMISGKVD